ncbi:MAG: metal ABC transporter ATP-binding protein [Candidatus Thermoplasmatota archaeon]|nr:metal ABC transporter ATP-binding protein [Candidatus Thermoplasmatota archaeon]MBS3802384.1 metal ABC transporter ATP-binding protein [Candidatus Thermoplasmatota archaeon]
MEKNPAIVDLHQVDTIYEGEKIPVIHDINLTVKKNDFLSIIGPNGAGKTTLLETINGILSYTAGKGKVFGKQIKKHKNSIRKHTGYVIQNFEIEPRAPFLCKDVVMSGRSGKIGLLRFPTKKDWDIVWKSMGLVGMIDYANRAVGKLSGGEFQKILLARALAQEPDLLLLDEPFSNLDFSARNQIEILLNRVHDQYKTTIVMVSHDLTFLPTRCNRLIVMDKGSIVMDDTKDNVLQSDLVHSLFPKGGKQ